MGEYEIRELCDEDADSVLATFAAAFGRERARDEWEWAFRQNPAGRRAFVAVRDGRVAAQYAGMPARAWALGEEHVFVQAVDAMVHPEHRRGLQNPGLFVRTAQACFEACGAPGGDAVHYGWPIAPAARVGRRFLDQELVREELVLVRSIASGWRRLPDGVERLERFDEQALWLYERCCGEWGASVVRDAARLSWRYLEHPRRRYACLGARDGEGLLRGLAVLREGSWTQAGALPLCEWLVPAGEREVGERLERAVLAAAAAQGAERVVALFPDWSPWFGAFQERGWRVHPSPYELVARSFERRIDAGWLVAHWWYQLGDSDLV